MEEEWPTEKTDKISMKQNDIEAHIFRANFNNINFEYFEL